MDIRRDNTSQVEYKLYNPKEPYMELNLALCKENGGEFNKVQINIEKNLFLIKIRTFSQVPVHLSLRIMVLIF